MKPTELLLVLVAGTLVPAMVGAAVLGGHAANVFGARRERAKAAKAASHLSSMRKALQVGSQGHGASHPHGAAGKRV